MARGAVRRLRREARWSRRAGLALVALSVLSPAALAGARAAQGEAARLDARARALVQSLAASNSSEEAARTHAQLEGLTDELLSGLEQATGTPAESGLLAPLFRIFAGRAEYARGASSEERAAWADEAVAYAERWGNLEAIVRARLLQCGSWAASGRVRDALESALELREAYPQARSRPFVLFQAASAAGTLGEYSRALDLLDELEENLPDEAWAAQLACQVPAERAQVYFGLGVLDLGARAVRQGRECLEALPSVGPNNAILMDVQSINVDQARGRLDAVVARIEPALEDALLYPPGSRFRGVLLGALGTALLDLERDSPARPARGAALLTEALAADLAQRDRVKIELTLAHLHLARGEPQRAAELLAAAGARLESWLRLSGTRGPIPEAVDLAAARAHLALATAAPAEVQRELRDELQEVLGERIRVWAELTPVRSGGSGFLHDSGTRAAALELARLEVALDPVAGAERALEAWMRVQALGSISRARGASAESSQALRAELLDSGGGLLVYLPGPHVSLVLAFDRAWARVVELPAESGLREILADSGATRSLEALRRLAQVLLPDELAAALERWAGGGLTVVGAELLGNVPFASLPLASGLPLGATHALDFLPSLPLGIALARAARAQGDPHGDWVVVAAPRLGSALAQRFGGLAELSWSPRAERAWEFAPPGGRPVFLSGAAATRSGLATALRGSAALQFVVHGVQDDRRERPAALALAPDATAIGGSETDGLETDDGLLVCDQVEELAAVPPLVILTACRATGGPLRAGDEGTGHLGGAFLRAGARVVLLADADLELEAVLRISAPLSEHLFQRGAAPAEALRAIQALEVRSGRAPLPLRVFGLGQVPLAPRRALAAPEPAPRARGQGTSLAFVLLGAAGLLWAASVWVRRRR